MAPKILMPKNYPKQPIALSKTAHHTTKMAHSKVQNGPQLHPKQPIVIIGIQQRVQSNLEILYVEASYTWVRGLDNSEAVKCSAMHYGVTCSKFKSVNGSTVCNPHKWTQ